MMIEILLVALIFLLIIFLVIGFIGFVWYQNRKIERLQKEVKSLRKRPASQPEKVIQEKIIQEKAIETISEGIVERQVDAPTVSTPSRISDDFSNIEISKDFENAFSLLENTSDCIFITGKAGTGKSTLLRYFVANTKKQVVVLAFTGIAALNIGGATIHSFFKFPPRPLTDDDIKESSNKEMYKAVDTIVIDEISMVRADLLDAIDKFLRINGKDLRKPFGGIQVVFFGDLFQLPPIVSDEAESQFFATVYQSPWFFDAHVLQAHPHKLIELTKVYRQKDSDFIALLDAIRTGHFNDSHLQKINQRFQIRQYPNGNTPNITLTSTNKIAHQINETELNKLPFPEFTYTGVIEGDFPKKAYPTETILRLKQGAQIMFVKNDSNRRWVNGTIGKVHSLENESIYVEVTDKGNSFVYNVPQEKWEILRYKFDFVARKLETEVIGAFTQYPLRLAWAVTIHKSQGLTFDKLVVDLGSGAFAHGQTYVALSRCTSYEGIFLKQRISKGDIRVDSEVNRYFSNARVLQNAS